MLYLAGGEGVLASEVYFASPIGEGVFVEKSLLDICSILNLLIYLAILLTVGDSLRSLSRQL